MDPTLLLAIISILAVLGLASVARWASGTGTRRSPPASTQNWPAIQPSRRGRRSCWPSRASSCATPASSSSTKPPRASTRPPNGWIERALDRLLAAAPDHRGASAGDRPARRRRSWSWRTGGCASTARAPLAADPHRASPACCARLSRRSARHEALRHCAGGCLRYRARASTCCHAALVALGVLLALAPRVCRARLLRHPHRAGARRASASTGCRGAGRSPIDPARIGT